MAAFAAAPEVVVAFLAAQADAGVKVATVRRRAATSTSATLGVRLALPEGAPVRGLPHQGRQPRVTAEAVDVVVGEWSAVVVALPARALLGLVGKVVGARLGGFSRVRILFGWAGAKKPNCCTAAIVNFSYRKVA
jgi:hypothetical protein